jgi:protease-4
MKNVERIGPGEGITADGGRLVIEIAPANGGRRLAFWLLTFVLVVSLALNLTQWGLSVAYAPPDIPELFHSGTAGAKDRIAVIPVEGTITPPFTGRWLRQIRRAADDATVKGVVLLIDSPGGFIADSHQLYRRVKELVREKPVSVSMKRMTASGGYYMAMGIGPEGRIFAEPTTWTGSIGVIIPRYNAAELADQIGVSVEPLVTGPFKDSLNPFRELSPDEQQVWDGILQDAFDRFVQVIVDGRSGLSEASVRKLATGQIYTAQQALDNQMIDEIGYLEDAIESLAESLQLAAYEAFEYRSTPGLIDVLLGASAAEPVAWQDALLESTIPRGMYYCSWNPWVPGK